MGHVNWQQKKDPGVMVWCSYLTLGLLLPLLRLKGPVQLYVYNRLPADFHTWVTERAIMSILMSYQIRACLLFNIQPQSTSNNVTCHKGGGGGLTTPVNSIQDLVKVF